MAASERCHGHDAMRGIQLYGAGFGLSDLPTDRIPVASSSQRYEGRNDCMHTWPLLMTRARALKRQTDGLLKVGARSGGGGRVLIAFPGDRRTPLLRTESRPRQSAPFALG